jgi:ABC-type nitrate/sulfonate/bicarbonate transport system ATPase subunit
MASISIENVRKLYGAVEVIRGVSIDIAVGEFVILVEPSGCGKSTFLGVVTNWKSSSAMMPRASVPSPATASVVPPKSTTHLFDGATRGHLAPSLSK